MVTYQVPELVLRISNDLCRKVDFGKRGFDDGTKDQQLHGIIAQNTVALVYGFPFVQESDTWDGGYDFTVGSQKIDIKNVTTNYTPKPHYEARVVSDQLRYGVNAYLFTAYNQRKNELTLCGWLPKHLFLDRARVYKRGDVIECDDGTTFTCRLNTHQIYLHQLNKIESIELLKDDLEIFDLLS